MPRKRPVAAAEPAHEAAPAVPVVDPRAVFFVDSFTKIFRVRKSTIRREWKAGRLRLSKRAGRIYVLGQWALEWLERGEVRPRPERPPPHNGHTSNGTEEQP